MMKKMKVYLDTSVISYLLQEDSPGKMAETRQLWRAFQKGKYDVFLSTVTLREIQNCPEPKRTQFVEYLNGIEYTILDITEECSIIAKEMVERGVLTKKSFDDCRHIGAAVINGCDCIISWNFKHIVNMRTIRGVEEITNLEGYRMIDIWTPSVLLEREEHSYD